MTGTEVAALRRDLALRPGALADLLGVHASTVYRWEGAGDLPARIETLQERLLTVLRLELVAQGPDAQANYARALSVTLGVRGPLYALSWVLDKHFRRM